MNFEKRESHLSFCLWKIRAKYEKTYDTKFNTPVTKKYCFKSGLLKIWIRNISMVYGQLQEEGLFQDTNVSENIRMFVSQKYQNTKTH